jgi:antitoxin component YwqK of YwqJK toxin-antitoxin module
LKDGKLILINKITGSVHFLRYKKGVLSGEYTIIYMNGRIQSGFFENGKSQGESLDIYPGDTKVTSFYTNGLRNSSKTVISGEKIISDFEFLEGVAKKDY